MNEPGKIMLCERSQTQEATVLGWRVPPLPNSYPLGPQNMTLFGNRVLMMKIIREGSKLMIGVLIRRPCEALASVAQLVGCPPADRRAAGSIPRGTCVGRGFSLCWGTCQLMFLSFPSPLSKINKHVLRWGFKLKKKEAMWRHNTDGSDSSTSQEMPAATRS